MKYRPLIPLLVLLSLLAWPPTLSASELDQIHRLFTQKRFVQTLDRVERYLKDHPKDARARFLKGLALIETNRKPEAIDVFKRMTNDFPKLPEPYNNLAVLYAEAGDFDQAQQALREAILTHPTYATAHENLGDIYAKMASMAYRQALQIDAGNQVAQAKLALVTKLIGAPVSPVLAAKKPKPAPVAAAKKSEPAPVVVAKKPEPAPVVVAKKPEPAPVVVAKKPKPAPVVVVKKPNPAPAVSKPEPKSDRVTALALVKRWAKAWSDQKPERYLAQYDADFKPPRKMTRSVWEKDRRRRLAKPKSIKVTLSNIRVEPQSKNVVRVLFNQAYRSETYQDRVKKRLILVRRGSDWKILRETVLR